MNEMEINSNVLKAYSDKLEDWDFGDDIPFIRADMPGYLFYIKSDDIKPKATEDVTISSRFKKFINGLRKE